MSSSGCSGPWPARHARGSAGRHGLARAVGAWWPPPPDALGPVARLALLGRARAPQLHARAAPAARVWGTRGSLGHAAAARACRTACRTRGSLGPPPPEAQAQRCTHPGRERRPPPWITRAACACWLLWPGRPSHGATAGPSAGAACAQAARGSVGKALLWCSAACVLIATGKCSFNLRVRLRVYEEFWGFLMRSENCFSPPS